MDNNPENVHKIFCTDSLFTCFDQANNQFPDNLATKRRYFGKPTYEMLKLSLHALKQHLRRHTI